MAQNTDLNVSPYYDDYSEDKNFHRILFRPSNAIQARELTQLQSILQNQVERFGNHVFDEGALVMGGTVTVNTLYEAVKVNASNPGSGTATVETYRTASHDKYYQGQTSGVVAKVVNSAAATTSGDPLTLYVTYVKANADSSSTTYSKFVDNEELKRVTLGSDGAYTDASDNNEFKTILPSEVAGHDSSTSTGSSATVRGGIFYTRGFFVRCDEQTVLLDKYSNTPTYRIGLQITESLQSSTDDTTLLDNASGTSNENAPGANRLKIALTLVAKATSGTQDIDNFIELSRVEEGTITKQTSITAYNTLERTLARRTFDESGDYIVKPFQVELREHYNDTLNNGIYLSSNTSTPGDSTKIVSVISPGKGYVKGFEVDKQSQSFVEINKARTKQDSGALAVPFEIGNYFNLDNVFGQPEFGTGVSGITPFGSVSLRDTAKANVEGGDGAEIGQARVRYFNCITPTVGSGVHTTASLFRVHLFDVRMYTKLTTQATMANYKLTAGQRIYGATSGAKATVAVSVTSGTTLYVMDVEGTFTTSEYIRAEWDSSTGITANQLHATSGTHARTYSSDRVRQVYQTSRTSGASVFAANTLTTDNQFVLTGTVIGNGGDPTQTGVNTKFTQELKEGDKIISPDGTSYIVSSITSDTSIELTGNGNAADGKYIRQRAQLQEQEKTISVMPTPKNMVSSITPNTVTIRKQALLQLSSGTGSISGVNDETLISEDVNDYIVAVHEAEGSESNPEDNNEGSVIDITEHSGVLAVGSGSNGAVSMDSTNSTPLGAADQLKVIYGATKDVANNNASKTLRRSRGVKITSTASTAPSSSASSEVYGTNVNDEIITLGVPDIYSLRAVYESNDDTDALPPKLTVASGFAGNPGDRITGSSSGAVGKIIQVSGTSIYFYYVSKALFTTDDTITNETSTNTSTNSRACSAVTVDSKNITGNFLFDDGQRDGYYGLGSIKRKVGAPTPTRRLLVIFDYFTAAAGNFFTVNSYSDLEFENIPNYIPNIIDPNGLEPDGEIELSDAVDFRSYVHSLHDVSSALDPTSATDVSSITAQPLAFATEEFTSARAITFDLPKSGQSLLTTAMEHYLPRIDKLSLSSDGEFVVSEGQPADEPSAPTTPSNSILLHTMYLPAYTKNLDNISVQSQDHKRFTMKDIGRIQGRVKNLERVTSLNALEQETSLTQIQDADGLDRFKSGFVTDNFRGHKTGDVSHPDYKIAVDRTTGTLRPQHNSKFVDISLNTGASSGYTKTGDMITLPFTETPYVTIDKASSTEFVNPYDVVLFNGTVELSPSRDLWFDTERLPTVRRSVEGDYDTVLKGVGNALGTIWNNWQSDWLGEPITTVEEPTNRTVTSPTPRRAMRGPGAQRTVNNRIRGAGGGGDPLGSLKEIRFERR